MAPLLSTNMTNHDHDDDMKQYQPGFTSNLINVISSSKAKMSEWAEMEKANLDAVAEKYRQTLVREQGSIDSQVADLLAIQLELGLQIKSEVSNDEETNENSERLVSRKKALE